MNERDDPLWHFVGNRLPGPPSSQFLGWRCVELDVERGTIAVEFKVSFLRPARLGKVSGRARIVHRGGALVFAEGELRDPEDRILATSTQTLRIVTIQGVELDFGQRAT